MIYGKACRSKNHLGTEILYNRQTQTHFKNILSKLLQGVRITHQAGIFGEMLPSLCQISAKNWPHQVRKSWRTILCVLPVLFKTNVLKY